VAPPAGGGRRGWSFATVSSPEQGLAEFDSPAGPAGATVEITPSTVCADGGGSVSRVTGGLGKPSTPPGGGGRRPPLLGGGGSREAPALRWAGFGWGGGASSERDPAGPSSGPRHRIPSGKWKHISRPSSVAGIFQPLAGVAGAEGAGALRSAPATLWTHPNGILVGGEGILRPPLGRTRPLCSAPEAEEFLVPQGANPGIVSGRSSITVARTGKVLRGNRIKSHVPRFVWVPVNPFKFRPCGYSP